MNGKEPVALNEAQATNPRHFKEKGIAPRIVANPAGHVPASTGGRQRYGACGVKFKVYGSFF
jgi:hypothetical protein